MLMSSSLSPSSLPPSLPSPPPRSVSGDSAFAQAAPADLYLSTRSTILFTGLTNSDVLYPGATRTMTIAPSSPSTSGDYLLLFIQCDDAAQQTFNFSNGGSTTPQRYEYTVAESHVGSISCSWGYVSGDARFNFGGAVYTNSEVSLVLAATGVAQFADVSAHSNLVFTATPSVAVFGSDLVLSLVCSTQGSTTVAGPPGDVVPATATILVGSKAPVTFTLVPRDNGYVGQGVCSITVVSGDARFSNNLNDFRFQYVARVLVNSAIPAWTPYSYSSVPYAPIVPTNDEPTTFLVKNGQPQVSMSGGIDDGYIPNVPIGFTFQFYGVNYNSVCVGTNGYLTSVAPRKKTATTERRNSDKGTRESEEGVQLEI